MSKFPLVSIIIPNYNGKQLLAECFEALAKLEYPNKNYEVILVDNDSNDTSVDFTKKKFPWVKLIESPVNLGFAGGCNLGIGKAEGKYVVLLNTDTKVSKKWLYYLVKRIESDNKIAAVNSKILLYYPFIELSINSDVYMRSEFTDSINFQQVGVFIENVVLDNPKLQYLIRYRNGFYEKESGVINARWTKGEATILIPCNPNIEEFKITLTIRSEKSSSKLQTKILVRLGEKELVSDVLNSYEVKQYPVILKTADLKKYFMYAVQNAGIVVFKNGYGRDRGAVVRKQEQFYELDSQFYNNSLDINAFCGASVIIRKDLFERAGGFDNSFFLYYEDVDLSLRFKRMGFRIVYEPKSVVYHIHAVSSVEGSSLFLYNVEKNRLVFVLKQFPLKIFFMELIYYFLLWKATLLRMIKWWLKEDWGYYELWKDRLECRSKVVRWVFGQILPTLKVRYDLSKSEKRSLKDVYQSLH